MKFPDDGEPRISSRELARLLGMSHEEMCRLIEENRLELLRLGPIVQTPIDPKSESQE
jgi:hypothetical protein